MERIVWGQRAPTDGPPTLLTSYYVTTGSYVEGRGPTRGAHRRPELWDAGAQAASDSAASRNRGSEAKHRRQQQRAGAVAGYGEDEDDTRASQHVLNNRDKEHDPQPSR